MLTLYIQEKIQQELDNELFQRYQKRIKLLLNLRPFSKYQSEYDLLVLPGGVKSLEKLRQEQDILNFIHSWDKDGKIISSTCHGAQLLISAKVVKGRNISGYYSLKDDIENAGANYSKEPVVVDKNIISSPHYDFMGAWMETTISEFNKSLKK